MSADSFKYRPTVIVFGTEPLLTRTGTIKSAAVEGGEGREGRDGYNLQSSLILSSTLYSNFKFILDRKYFQKIKENENHFFSMPAPAFG